MRLKWVGALGVFIVNGIIEMQMLWQDLDGQDTM